MNDMRHQSRGQEETFGQYPPIAWRLRETHQRANEPENRLWRVEKFEFQIHKISQGWWNWMKLIKLSHKWNKRNIENSHSILDTTRHTWLFLIWLWLWLRRAGTDQLKKFRALDVPTKLGPLSAKAQPRDNLRQLKNAGNIWKPQKSSFDFGQVEL